MALNIENIVAELETATILELSELVKAIEEKFDVSAAAPVAVAGPGAAAAEEKTEFDVELTSAGDKKVLQSKQFAKLLVLDLKKLKILLTAHQLLSKKVFQKLKLKQSLKLSALLAVLQVLNNLLIIKILFGVSFFS